MMRSFDIKVNLFVVFEGEEGVIYLLCHLLEIVEISFVVDRVEVCSIFKQRFIDL